MVSRVGKFVGGFNQDVTNTVNAHATENRVVFGHGDTNPTANVHVVGDILATTSIKATGGIGLAGNTAPAAITLSLGNPANVIIRTDDDTVTGSGNVIIGDKTGTTSHSLDVRGSANVGFFGATVGTFSSTLTAEGATSLGNEDNPATDGDAKSSVVIRNSLAFDASPESGIAFENKILTDGSRIKSGAISASKENATENNTAGKLELFTRPNGGTLTSALAIDSSQNVSIAGRLVVDDTTEATSTTDGSLQTDGGLSVAGDAVFGDDIKLITDASVASFGVNGEITLTHVHNTGLLLEDSGGSPTLQLHDANESVSSDGSKLILTSNGVAFNLPTADGTADQVIKTDGSGTLSFADAATGDPDPATTLSSNTDCGTAVAAADGQDAFGVAIDDAFVELDLKTQAANKLGTVDMGALS